MRKSFLTATLLATAASYAAAPVAPSHSAEPTFDLSISGTGKGFLVYHNGKKAYAATPCKSTLNTDLGATCPQVDTSSNADPEWWQNVAHDTTSTSTVPTSGYDIIRVEGEAAGTSKFHNPQIEIDSNIMFSASMMHEGWNYSAYLRIDAFNKDDTRSGGSSKGDIAQGDSFFLSIGKEDMGTLYLGAHPGASNNKWIYMPGAGAYTLYGGDAQSTHGILTNGGELPWWSENHNKVMYVSPDFNGFSFAASYTPQKATAAHFNGLSKKELAGTGLDAVEMQGLFVMDGLKVSAGFAHQNVNGSKAWDGQLAVDNSFNVLASYSMEGLTVGAGYLTHPVFSKDKWTVYGGAQYAFTDDWSFGAGYLAHDNSDDTNGDGLVVANINYTINKKASWNTGVSIPTKGDNWSIASGLVYHFGPNV